MTEETEFEAELNKATAQREAMAAALKTIRDLCDGRLLVVVADDPDGPARLVTEAEFDGPTRIVLTIGGDYHR